MSIPGMLVPPDEERVTSIVSLLGVGRQNAKTAHELQRLMGLQPQPTAETARGLLRSALIDHQHLVGACSRGYYIIETEDEYGSYRNSLKKRQAGIQQRLDALEEAFRVRAGRDPRDTT